MRDFTSTKSATNTRTRLGSRVHGRPPLWDLLRPRLSASLPLRAGAVSDDVIPTVEGYTIDKELGRGGMGVVYKAVQVKLGRTVALKMILAAHAQGEERDRFASEAEAVARFQHPNIVQIFEVGEAEGRPYLSLEYVEGGSLEDKLDGKPLAWKPAAELLAVLALTMHAAHL